MRPLRSSLSAFAAGLLCLATACHADEAAPAELPELGLMGTIPIYWGESDDFGQLLSDEGEVHWARAQLEAEYRLRLLDMLSEESLAGLEVLMLAQPRALSPQENVALDTWVRRGGKLLLFADPLLTGESRFAIGDRRRPQDVILLSPILNHWGLTLVFDDEAPAGYTLVPTAGVPIPVNLPGSLSITTGEADCELRAADVLAECAIGQGRALVLADAALLDLQQPHPRASPALAWLTREAFGTGGESAGN